MTSFLALPYTIVPKGFKVVLILVFGLNKLEAIAMKHGKSLFEIVLKKVIDIVQQF